MPFVETRRGTAEPVVAAGEIGYVYKEYYGKSWTRVESAPQLEAIRDLGRQVWMLYTFPMYVERKMPGLMAAIRRKCIPKQVLPGTVGGGDIVVCVI